MNLLKLKPATQLVNGQQSACYAIWLGDTVLRTVSIFSYTENLRYVRHMNRVIDSQARAMVEQGKRIAAGNKALYLCGLLPESSRARLTAKTIKSRNKARALYV